METAERHRGALASAVALLFVFVAIFLPSAAAAAPPLVTTNPATEVAKESTKLNGTVNPTGLFTTFWFEYGTTKSYGSKSAVGFAGSGSSPQYLSSSVKGLTKGTLYHYRVVAQNASGTSYGADETFTTQPLMAVTQPATEVFGKDATLHGYVSSEGVSGTYYFQYGTTEAYGSKTAEKSITNTGLQPVEEVLSGLTPGTTYYFRIVLVTGGETRVGVDRTFATPKYSWYLQTTPNPAHFEGITCLSGTECIAVGDETSAAEWDGTEWSAMSIPGPGELDNVSCSSLTACTAVGMQWTEGGHAPLVVRWNGSEWKAQEFPVPAGVTLSSLSGISCTSSTYCLAAGDYRSAEEEWKPLAGVWNGSEWKLQTVPAPAGKSVNYVRDLSCSSSTACTAVGYSSMEPLALRWNGSEWKVQTPPGSLSPFESVSCVTSTFCVAVGDTYFTEEAYAAKWNGTSWSSLAVTAPVGSQSDALRGVSCASTTACTAVGWHEPATGFFAPYSASWNGTSWQTATVREPSSADETFLKDVDCLSATLCEAVGSYSIGVNFYTLAERFE